MKIENFNYFKEIIEHCDNVLDKNESVNAKDMVKGYKVKFVQELYIMIPRQIEAIINITNDEHWIKLLKIFKKPASRLFDDDNDISKFKGYGKLKNIKILLFLNKELTNELISLTKRDE